MCKREEFVRFENQQFAEPTSDVSSVEVETPGQGQLTSEAAPLFRRCGYCSEPIAPKRLQARPEAKYCIVCQPQFDRRMDAGAAMAVMSEMDGAFEQYMGFQGGE